MKKIRITDPIIDPKFFMFWLVQKPEQKIVMLVYL
jgi:hypothetical protein